MSGAPTGMGTRSRAFGCPHSNASTATYFGFNYRKAGYAEGELCDLVGTTLPLAKTKADRLVSGDPRPSLEERYPTPRDYVAAVEASTRRLVEDRLLLDEDARRIVERAAQAM